MIKSPALVAWLADAAALERTSNAIDGCAHKWLLHPAMVELDAAVRAPGKRSSDALLAAACRFLDRSDDLEALVQDLIANLRDDPFFLSPFGPIANELMQGLLLYNHPELLVALCVTRLEELAGKKAVKPQASGSINFNGYSSLMRFVDAGDAVLTLWEAPRIGENFAAADAGRCRIVEKRRIVDGEEVLIDGRYQSFTVDHAVRDLVFFQVTVFPDSAPVSAEYDSETCELVGTSSADEAASRIQMMATLLRAMDCQEAMPVLEATLSSPQFYARWHVMREMLALDAEASLPALKRLAEGDPHADVRFAARQTLETFFVEETQPEAGASACPA